MSRKTFEVLTLFPEMFSDFLRESMIGRAIAGDKIAINIHDIRKYSRDKHRKVDARPYGGGTGMVLRPEPIYAALDDILEGSYGANKKQEDRDYTCVVLLSPKGRKFEQSIAVDLQRFNRYVLICGHYEGFDERISQACDIELSIGDYILTCGELPAMVVMDAMTRLIPGVLGGGTSAVTEESFENNLLEPPHYTRPAVFRNMETPDVLREGNHREIESWRREQAEKLTKKRRPDLYHKYEGGDNAS